MAGHTYGARDSKDNRPGLKKLGELQDRKAKAAAARLAGDRRPAAEMARTFVFSVSGRPSIAPFKGLETDPLRVAAEAIYQAYLVTPPAPRDPKTGRRTVPTISLAVEAALVALGDEFTEENDEVVQLAVDHAMGADDKNDKHRQGAYAWGFSAAEKAAAAKTKAANVAAKAKVVV